MTGNKSHLILPTLLTLIGVAILCTLGTWQVKRLAWKEQLIKAYAASAKTPVQNPDKTIFDKGFIFQKATITGHLLPDTIVRIEPRTYNGEIGYHLYQAFQTKNGLLFFINKGWFNDNNPPEITPQNQTVTGTFKKFPRPNFMTPDNPQTGKTLYFPLKEDLEKAASTPQTLPYEFVPDDALGIQIEFKNDHLQYAIFWFAMAGVLIAVYYLRFLKKPN